MIDPTLSLAVSMHGNKGIYSLLLGSGVSRSSGILTGWDIVQDLIRRLAHVRKTTCEPDPDAWFRATFNLEPDYSEVLEQIAKSSAERGQILRAYFEPTEDERADGLKQPTRAHRAIAELVAKGYVRVIVSTNFDRLIEQALADAGVQPIVISSPDAARGALPLAHSRCTLVKVNGDYLDTRLRNTSEELEAYEGDLERLLAQIFDEYGLIMCGWSAEWDTALRRAIERCSTRRFTTYWASRGAPQGKAENLANLRGAFLVSIKDADTFFRQVADDISALETFAVSDPLPGAVAVARLKKYLADDSHQINVHDLLTSETEKAYAAFRSERLPPEMPTAHTILARLNAYEASLQTILPLAICGAYWARPPQAAVLLRCFKRLADQYEPRSGVLLWSNLSRYPALVLLYGMGLAAIAKGNDAFLRDLLLLGIRNDKSKPEEPVVRSIDHQKVLAMDTQKALPGREREYTPLCNHLYGALRSYLKEYIPEDNAYDELFDWFEYLLCLV